MQSWWYKHIQKVSWDSPKYMLTSKNHYWGLTTRASSKVEMEMKRNKWKKIARSNSKHPTQNCSRVSWHVITHSYISRERIGHINNDYVCKEKKHWKKNKKNENVKKMWGAAKRRCQENDSKKNGHKAKEVSARCCMGQRERHQRRELEMLAGASQKRARWHIWCAKDAWE